MGPLVRGPKALENKLGILLKKLAAYGKKRGDFD